MPIGTRTFSASTGSPNPELFKISQGAANSQQLNSRKRIACLKLVSYRRQKRPRNCRINRQLLRKQPKIRKKGRLPYLSLWMGNLRSCRSEATQTARRTHHLTLGLKEGRVKSVTLNRPRVARSDSKRLRLRVVRCHNRVLCRKSQPQGRENDFMYFFLAIS